MVEKIPDTYERAVNFLCAIDSLTFGKLERMVEDVDNIDDAGMTYKTTVEMCLIAEQRVKKKLSAMAMASKMRNMNKKPKPQPDQNEK